MKEVSAKVSGMLNLKEEELSERLPGGNQTVFGNRIARAKTYLKKAGLEIGPGTGQATAPILETGCDYNAIEPGEHLYEGMKHKHGQISQFLHRKR